MSAESIWFIVEKLFKFKYLSKGEIVQAYQFHTLEVIAGPMFSGKTEELIRRIRRARIARLKVQIFKHALDNRYEEETIASHSDLKLKALCVYKAHEILDKLLPATRVVAIDEAQFFDESLTDVITHLVNRGIRVMVAGLDMDSSGMPFGPMAELLAKASKVDKISAICTICGQDANFTQRLVQDDNRILVGKQETYEARCPMHWEGPEQEQTNANCLFDCEYPAFQSRKRTVQLEEQGSLN